MRLSFLILAVLLPGLLLLPGSCKKDDLFVPVTGKVIDRMTRAPIENATIVYNVGIPGRVDVVTTDPLGVFRGRYYLDGFLADSILFFIGKENYSEKVHSGIIGNTQKDMYLIELDSL